MEKKGNDAGKGDHPGVYIPPPMIYVAMFFISIGLQRILPLSTGWLQPGVAEIGGWIMLGAALLCLLPAFWRFGRSRNTLITVKPAKSLQTSGIYAVTRNPMYLALLLMYTWIAFLRGNTWTFLLIVPLMLVVQTYVIRKEEQYLQRAFGAAFDQYKTKVRRWL